ncbi:CpaF family protein [Candidatus Woesearchaeota archaeon]|nr:CpaF family protein [Candidatus Woesearchaeota archaeon]MBT3538069.1 CpaF family protein [Candidatus Woesearchaeota archaeon]MBT4717144.1 CpaF family protein [Candidatus Woesearchaeota archaeon]MBT7105738.1 CpaF family protein [Candidatus Woesearchaeota archaeon]MBT7930564.1 CpaF family protein [Candidatus Woesearchaeota archaeon]
MQPVLVDNYPHVMIYEVAEKSYFYQLGPAILQLDLKGVVDFFLKDDNLEEIMYNGPAYPIRIYHKKYGFCDTNVRINEIAAKSLIDEVAALNQKTITPQNPTLDGTLMDGSRVNITIPPASYGGSTITIRKFTQKILNIIDLMRSNVLTSEVAAFLWTVVEGLSFKPSNIIFAGGTGSGKTTTLNALLMFMPIDSRIITIEDTMELRLKQGNVVRMLANEEQGVTMDALLNNALRMRPDRILVGEVRGPEALTLFNAMNTGHEGCMGTLHANDVRHVLVRVTSPPMNVPENLVSALDLVVMQERVSTLSGHFRRITEVTELSGAEEGNIRFNTLYKWNPSKNKLLETGIPSKLRTRISQAAGISIKEFDKVLKKRIKVLEKLLKNKADTETVMQAISDNRFK